MTTFLAVAGCWLATATLTATAYTLTRHLYRRRHR